MAVTSTTISADLAIVFDQSGTSITRRYADVKIAATDADIYDVAAGLAGISSLQDLTVSAVQRRNTNELENA
jgi:hypothetical protein